METGAHCSFLHSIAGHKRDECTLNRLLVSLAHVLNEAASESMLPWTPLASRFAWSGGPVVSSVRGCERSHGYRPANTQGGRPHTAHSFANCGGIGAGQYETTQ